MYVNDLKIANVSNAEEAIKFLELGMQNRSVGRTNMNEYSSRSHLIYTIYVSCKNGYQYIS